LTVASSLAFGWIPVPSLGAHSTEFALHGKRLVFFSLAAVTAILLLAAAVIRAGAVASFNTVSQGDWILRFDRDDALLEDRLGQIDQDSGSAQSIQHLRRATDLSPLNYLYHAHLASACEAFGDPACADREWELVARLCPMVPIYQSHAAQSYLRSHQTDEALIHFQRLLELAPDYGTQSWTTLRGALDPDVIFRRTISPTAALELKLSYVTFLSNRGNDEDDDAAFRIWQIVVPENVRESAPGNPPFSFASAQLYLERLLDLGRISEADRVWRDLQRLKVITTPPGTDADDLIFNGDFEQLPLNAGFDWRLSDQNNGLDIDFAAPDAYHGAHCFRIDFAVNRNQEYEPAFQLVRVLPNRSYRLGAYVRSEQITSDTGPTLRISDPEDANAKDVASSTTTGTTPWHPIGLSFSTGPNTHLVRLSIWRPRGRVFPTEISGTFWVDALSLRDAGPAPPQPLPERAAQEQQQR
jgi:tetratricopeptide (TPR) repeat protein